MPWTPSAKRAFLDQQFALQHEHYVHHYCGAEFFVVERDADPAGRYYVLREADDFLVVDISIERAVRGQGIGTALIAWTQGRAGASGCGVRLHVQRENAAAQRFYVRLGFSPGRGEGAAYLPMRWTPVASRGA